MNIDRNSPTSTRRRYLTAAGAVTTGAFAGCLGFLIEEAEGEVQMVAEQEVSVGPNREDAFDPQLAHVEEGGTVTFNWVSGNHDVTSFHLANDVPDGTPEGSTPFSENIAGPGEQLSVDFDQVGVYNILCVRHQRVGMMMSIIVGEPEDLDAEPALDEPDPALADAMQDQWRELNDQVREHLGGGTND